MNGSNSNQGNQNGQNQNKQNVNQSNQPKPALSWSQPANTAHTTPNKPVAKVETATLEPQDSTGRVIGIIVGIIIVFALVAWGIVTMHKKSVSDESASATTTNETIATDETQTTDTSTTPAPATTDTTKPDTSITSSKPAPVATPVATAPAGSATFSVPATQDAGSQVSVTGLSLSAPTWIIVYDNADSATPGWILGAGLYFPGDSAGTVHLLRPTVSSKTYSVSAALDDGNKSFNKATEKYVTDATGAQVWMKFQTR